MLANISIKVILRMFFLIFSIINFEFDAKKLTRRSYTVTNILPTTSQIELIDKTEFVKLVLDENSETFIIYILAFQAIERFVCSF